MSLSWNLIGPDGGDARAMTAVPGHPEHLYVGTTNSLIYESVDEGKSWRQFAHLDNTDDLVVDHILVDRSDTSTIYAAAWKFDHPDGGLWISHDRGRTFVESRGLHGQSIRAFAQSASAPRTLIAGTLKGVYRSTDAGANWELISPPGSKEIHEVESIAIDPKNPEIIYAGTWHLPWKTTDGGEHWVNIKQGVIDDSDVFSIILDPHHSSTAYLSACSGIYKTENGGGQFHKIQGIPATARRTRVLHQDPSNRDTVYAGTTEGLYKTTDAGRTFRHMGPEVIINDVFVDPSDPDHVILATDRSGILSSTDGGATFDQTNTGFHERKVEALLVDANSSSRLYAGVVNDKTYGGVFVSGDSGATWKQMADGLDGRDIFVLSQSADGHIFAGTNSGIFTLADDAWQPANTISNTDAKAMPEVLHGKQITVEKKVKEPTHQFSGRVFALDLSGDAWAAATTSGLYTSKDQGATWQGGMVMGFGDYTSITSHGTDIAAARYSGVLYSHDAGQNWWPMGVPTAVTHIYRAAFSSDGTLWIGTREGVYFTRDKGKTWMWIHRLPLVDVSDLYYDAKQNKVLVSSRTSDFIYAIDASNLSWTWRRTGYKLFLVRSNGGRLLAASIDQGVLAEPEGQQAQAGQQ